MMFERILKTLLGIMLMVFFTQRLLMPVILESRQASAKLAEVKSSLQQMASSEQVRIRNVQKTERQMMDAMFNELSQLLPDFNKNRSAAVSRLEMLRDRFAGTWQIQPGTQPIHEGNMVRWPVRLSFSSDFHTAMNLLKHLETGESLNRIATLDISPSRSEGVEMVINMEMLFSKTEVSGPDKLAGTISGGSI